MTQQSGAGQSRLRKESARQDFMWLGAVPPREYQGVPTAIQLPQNSGGSGPVGSVRRKLKMEADCRQQDRADLLGALIAIEFGREAHTRGVSEGVDRSVSSSSVDDVRKNIHQRRHGRGWEEEECVCRIKEHHSKLTSQKRSVKTCNRTQEITKKGNFNA